MDYTKHERSITGINRWESADSIGTLLYVTGFGKTRTGLLAANRILEKKPTAKIVILTASDAVGKVWAKAITAPDEFFSFTPWQITNSFSIYSAATMSNILNGGTKNICWDLVIFDEIHKFTAPERYTLFSRLDYKTILGLTGTYPIGVKKAMLDKYCPVVDIISEREALDNGWISNFVEYNIACQLTDEDRARYEKFTVPIHETMELFKNLYKKFIRPDNTLLFKDDYHLIQSCKSGLKTKDNLGHPTYIPADHVRQLCATFMGWTPTLPLNTEYNRTRDEYWNPENIKNRVAIFTDFVDKRQDIIINSDVKLEKVVEIFKDSQLSTICFNESTEFADRVAKRINDEFGSDKALAVVYHSNMESRPLWDDDIQDYIRYGSGQKAGEIKVFGQATLKKIAVEGLASGYYKFLSTARALDEGLDIPTIEQVITTAGTANPIQYIQRTGRGKRVDIYNPNKVTKIFNLYFEDFVGSSGNIVKSRDKQKLIAKQTDRNSTVIWVEDLADLLSD